LEARQPTSTFLYIFHSSLSNEGFYARKRFFFGDPQAQATCPLLYDCPHGPTKGLVGPDNKLYFVSLELQAQGSANQPQPYLPTI
jgi:hypothetical protein